MQENHRQAVGADARLAVADDRHAVGLHRFDGGVNVPHLVAEMVYPALGIAFQEPGDGGCFAQRVDEFDLAVRQFHEDGGHAVLGQRLRRRNRGPERISVKRRGRVEVRHRDGDVVESPDHRFLPGIILRIALAA